ncbi:DNA-processing protein DprA [Ornithinibacillus massiliensis]|uniref:DNA-processing protein DprA n=1 Tax=Ornithinibacillus massiliensis TaxID=1944633 RepID=A0ABS5MD76_9BACI|nr:DNA-processing protein DprA [Ornithinibacillus massiliensis]MBS3680062.1 DNA-processing protein DprA [Ornithinibacillus massiliensis]
MSRRNLRRLLRMDPSLAYIFLISSTEISHYLSIRKNQAEILYQDIHNTQLIHDTLQDIKAYHIITLIDETYPPMLKTIKDAPIVLYCYGDDTLLYKTPSISVIGTRNPSLDAMNKTKYIISPLIKDNWVIVSGMAKGIDSYAHRLALHEGGKTIAVLGSGFEYIYPNENTFLFQLLVKDGLALSEYPPKVPPRKFHFPERNRIISGLSFATVVIEATERSGTMITVDQALDQGREVFAVPGSPHIPQSIGCLKLIQEGATMAVTYEDIMSDWRNKSFLRTNPE